MFENMVLGLFDMIFFYNVCYRLRWWGQMFEFLKKYIFTESGIFFQKLTVKKDCIEGTLNYLIDIKTSAKIFEFIV